MRSYTDSFELGRLADCPLELTATRPHPLDSWFPKRIFAFLLDVGD